MSESAISINTDDLIDDLDAFFARAFAERKTMTPEQLHVIFSEEVKITRRQAEEFLRRWRDDPSFLSDEFKEAADIAHPKLTGAMPAAVITAYTANTIAEAFGITDWQSMPTTGLEWHGSSLFENERRKKMPHSDESE